MVAVRYPEGVSHGFLVLRTQEGKPIADGDLTQIARTPPIFTFTT
jgi:hypothetical protein